MSRLHTGAVHTDNDSHRKPTALTLDLARNIIASEEDFTAITNAFRDISEPDMVGGSGVTLLEYWLDDTGKDIIQIIYEQGQIYHVYYKDEETEQTIDTPYDPKQT